tara:strand:+ start:1684 stop:3492 length:1809 start_codon:yes stop_codon:yes gene_type:complete
MIDIFLFFLFYISISFVFIGFGEISKIMVLNKYRNLEELGFTGFMGFLFLYLISSLIFFFSNINQYIILSILVVGLGLFIFFLVKKKYNYNSLLILLITLTLFFPMVIISEPTEDFFFYYQPYMNYLQTSKIIFGLVNINSTLAFSTYSLYDIIVLFKINGIFENSFSIPIMIFYIFFLIYLIENLFKKFGLFYLFILFLSIISFSKLRDIGTSIPPQLLLIIVFCLIYSIFLEGINDIKFSKILLLLCFAIILRFNSIIILPLIILLSLRYYKFVLSYLSNNKKTIFFIFILTSIYFSKNIITSGCLVYPINKLCFENLTWSSNLEVTNQKYNKLSSDSKGWPFYAKENFKIDDKFVWKNLKKEGFIGYNDYLKTNISFWIKYWIKDPNYKKIINLFLLCLLGTIILNIYRKGNINYNVIQYKNYIFLLLSICLVILFWLIISPQMRYGGYFSFIIFFSLIFSQINSFVGKKTNLISLAMLIFVGFAYVSYKNIKRINEDFEEKKFINYPWPNNHELITNIDYTIFYKDNFTYYKRIRTNKLIFDNGEQAILMCGNINFPCIPEGKEVCLGKRIENNFFVYYQKNFDEKKCFEFMNENILY